MSGTFKLSVCEHFRPEAEWFVRAELEASGASIDLTVFPARCAGFTGCLHAPEPLQLGGCLSLIAPPWLLENLVREGAYLAGPGWLANWRTHVDAWGFDAAGLQEFAGESIRRLCLIDTMTVPGIEEQLVECAAALGVPSMRIPVGMHYCSGRLRRLLEPADVPPAANSEVGPPRQEADYAMALDLLSGLVNIHTEREVVIQLQHILTMLFAPSTLRLISFADGAPATMWSGTGMAEPPDNQAREISASNPQSIIDNEEVLIVPLDFDRERLALVVLGGFAMPNSRAQYRNVLEAIAPILSLSLQNARTYEELVLEKAALNAKHDELTRTLAFRDQLLSIIAHDLRGPLGSMGGVLEILADDLAGTIPDEQAMYVRELKKTANNTYALLDELLAWARLQTSDVAPPGHGREVGELVELVFGVLGSSASAKAIALHNEVPEDLTVDADPNILQAILRNLVSNAVKFTPSGGSVTVRADNADKVTRISVTDTGVGMDEQTLSRLRDSKRRFSSPGTGGEHGTGLGLLFCKELATRIGATLDISSTPGVGTTASLIWDRRSGPTS